MTSVTGTPNQINVAGTTDVTLSLAPNLKLLGDVSAKTLTVMPLPPVQAT